MHVINHAVPVKQIQIVFICGDEMISKCLYNILLAVQRIRRATLAGFDENNVVHAKYHKSVIRIAVMYEVIKCCTCPIMYCIMQLITGR